MIIFQNPGVLDPRLITTMGAHVKEDESAIGYFGTGLKYAIAVLLREGQTIIMRSGEDEYTFALDKQVIRGKSFQFITMNNLPAGFTTELGKNWSLANAYRELYCNCIDEKGTVQKYPDGPVPHNPKATTIAVFGTAFDITHEEREEFLLNSKSRRRLAATHACEVYFGRATQIFYRGIAVCKLARPSNFTYNLLTKMDLTEDRTVAEYSARYIIADTLAQVNDYSILEAIAIEDTLENDLNFDYTPVTSAFHENMAKLMKAKPSTINRSAVSRHFKTSDKHKPQYVDVVLNATEQSALDRAIAFCQVAGFQVDTFPIRVVESCGENTLAMAINGEILLTRECFTKHILREALIEEYVHLAYKVLDNSRAMQNILFTQIIRLGEQLQ
jgi:hypothetical protein